MKPLEVNAYSERWLKRGFPWVYRKELLKRGARPGQWVTLRGSGRVLGTGLADSGWIAARVVRHGEGAVDRDYLFGLLDRAASYREQVIPPATTGYRLVNAENDGLPGVRMDWWEPFAVIALDSPALAPLLPHLLAWLQARRQPRGVYLCYRPDPRDDQDLSAVEPAPGLIAGHKPSSEVVVRECGMKVLVRPWEGPDVGLYADMRAVRSWLEPHWGGTRVLNTFCYTGVFSVAAALAGASSVTSVDLSAAVLARAEANFRVNDLDPGGHDFLVSDTFKALDRLRRTGERFERVLLDPPSFSRSSAGVWSAKKDTPRLVAAAARVLTKDGWLIAASNQGDLSPRDFRGLVMKGLERAGRGAQEIAWLGQAEDFPAAVSFPEGRYLKLGVWRLL